MRFTKLHQHNFYLDWDGARQMLKLLGLRFTKLYRHSFLFSEKVVVRIVMIVNPIYQKLLQEKDNVGKDNRKSFLLENF
jgi:hypothetical protein